MKKAIGLVSEAHVDPKRRHATPYRKPLKAETAVHPHPLLLNQHFCCAIKLLSG